jgi:hypothetical protein
VALHRLHHYFYLLQPLFELSYFIFWVGGGGYGSEMSSLLSRPEL